MTILVGSDVPGLLGALEQALGGPQQLAIVREAEQVASLLANPSYRIDALILSDTIAPHPGKDVATSLWELASFMSRSREQAAPVVMTLGQDTPMVIQDALRAEARKTGGDVCTLSHRARTHDHPEARKTVAWIVEQLKLEPPRRQRIIVSTSNAGGSGKTSTVINVCLQLSRLGLRVLVVDLDIAQGALTAFLRAGPEVREFYTTLPDEHPNLVSTYPVELVERRVVHHASGLDVLFSGHGVRDQLDMSTACLEGLIDTIGLMDYDVVCFDMPGDWKGRPVIISLLTRRAATPFVICPPGRKERLGALSALDVLARISREDGRPAVESAMVIFIEGERGHAMDIRSVRQDVLRQYPQATDLGTLPRDPALLSMAAERREFCSVFDLAPRSAYCHAIRAAARRWAEAAEIPPAWMPRTDPDERLARRPLWERFRTFGAAPRRQQEETAR